MPTSSSRIRDPHYAWHSGELGNERRGTSSSVSPSKVDMERTNPLRRFPLLLLSGALAAVLLGSCSPSPPQVSVNGRLIAVGGPVAASRPLRGEVRFRASDGATYSISVGRDGRFSIRLPAGRYGVRGRSPEYESDRWYCSDPRRNRVTVTTTASPRVTVVCDER